MPISLTEDSRLPGGEYTSWNKCQEFKLRIFTLSTAVVPLYFSIDRFQNIVLILKRCWKPFTFLKYLISLYLSEILIIYKITNKHFLSLFQKCFCLHNFIFRSRQDVGKKKTIFTFLKHCFWKILPLNTSGMFKTLLWDSV